MSSLAATQGENPATAFSSRMQRLRTVMAVGGAPQSAAADAVVGAGANDGAKAAAGPSGSRPRQVLRRLSTALMRQPSPTGE